MQAMLRDILLDIPKRFVGVPPSPGPDALRPVEHACGVAFPFPAGRVLFVSLRNTKSISIPGKV